jgi:pimeloyl-ACP methyl ester carboxylesterase
MATLTVAGHDLYYEVHGAGTPILGIHGSPSSAVFWEDAATDLAELGRCILYDRRGYHRSAWSEPPPAIDLEDQLDDAVAVLDHVSDAPAVVIGRSTGGLIALALAVRRPDRVRALVLLEPALFSLHPDARRWARELREQVLAFEGAAVDTVVHRMFDLALGPEFWESLPEAARAVFAAGGTAMLAEMRGAGLDLSAEPFSPGPEELARVRLPTLVLSGDASYDAAMAVDDRLVAELPDARHEVVPGGHVIHPAHPAVLAFVRDVLKAQGSTVARA